MMPLLLLVLLVVEEEEEEEEGGGGAFLSSCLAFRLVRRAFMCRNSALVCVMPVLARPQSCVKGVVVVCVCGREGKEEKKRR